MSSQAPKTPKQMLRERRPERFSDSRIDNAPKIDRSTLEYHLSTLTNRNQESDFQNFALKLAQVTLCPNLRPQTGPTGGGDSKADAETYPVADELALTWFVGTGREAAIESWAFAFSTKQAWKGKVESDIAKIAETRRSYSHAFFISSQFIPDRKRAEVEDSLRQMHGLERVTILDRNWILDQVFKGNHQDMTIAELHISVAPRTEVVQGPLDTQRERDLSEAESKIVSLLSDGSNNSRLIAYAIEAGRLACELERPRNEVEGRLRRAVDLADRYGSNLEKVEARYQYAWCAFWWLEDAARFLEFYSEIENLTKDSTYIVELRLVHTLWYLLFGVKTAKRLPDEHLRWNDHILVLANALEKSSKIEGRPSAALEARAMLLFQQTAVSMPNVPPAVFEQFKEVFERSKGFVGFPLKKTIELISELGEILPDSEAFDDLNEKMVELVSENEGESAAAKQLLGRAWDKLEGDRNYEAIELAGRAAQMLWKYETQEELVEALYVLAIAYESVGLMWAARGSFLNAASIMTQRWDENHDPEEFRLACFSRFKWIELLLGRLPDSLAWYRLEGAIRSEQIVRSPEKQKAEQMFFDGVLGMYFLRAALDTLKKFERFPDVFGKMGLLQTRVALLWALGWIDEAAASLSVPEGQDLQEAMVEWRDQPAIDDLPVDWELGDGSELCFSSSVLGCDVRLVADNNSTCRLVGESFLAALEAMLATAFRERLMPLFGNIEITVSSAVDEQFPLSSQLQDSGVKLTCAVKCSPFDPNKLTHPEQEAIKDKLTETIIGIVGYLFPLPEYQERIKRILVTGGGFVRALNFTGSFVTSSNVLGDNPPVKLENWVFDETTKFELRRTEPWDADLAIPRRMPQVTADSSDNQPREDVSHKKMAALSVINLRLWEKAKWGGTMYYYFPGGEGPPTMALGFNDVEAGREIFQGWIEQFGWTDEGNTIRVTIVKGISRHHPSAYRILISGNPEGDLVKGKIIQGNLGRMQTMDTPDGRNLKSFLDHYEKHGKYTLGFGKMSVPGSRLDSQTTMEKRGLIVREAWSIGENDIDSMGVQPEDDPIIPKGVTNVPVMELLKRIRAAT